MRYFEGTSPFATLIVIAKFVMVLSHGQSAVERGFRTNKSLLIENLSEKSLINQRIVVDYMKSNDYKPFNTPLINELIRSVRDAHRKYIEDLHGKKKELLQEKNKKKNSINENIMTLSQRQTLLENTITEMMKDSVRLAFEAEKKTKFELLSKSNALKRAANEKQAKLDQCLKEKKRLLEMKTHQ